MSELHTDYYYMLDIPSYPEILFNIFFDYKSYNFESLHFFDTMQNHQKIAKLCKYTVKIAQILLDVPPDPMLKMYNMMEETQNPLHRYLCEKLEYDDGELELIVNYNIEINFKFPPDDSKTLLFKYFAKVVNITPPYKTILYLLSPFRPFRDKFFIEILDTVFKTHNHRQNSELIKLIIKKYVNFSQVNYDFFTPYLDRNTTVDVDILDLLKTESVSKKIWDTEVSPVEIYLLYNNNKQYEEKEKVIRTLSNHLDLSCIKILDSSRTNIDGQLSDLFKELTKQPIYTQEREPEQVLVLDGGKYRNKSAKNYKFLYKKLCKLLQLA
jgi:hypothetical protein